MIYNNAQMKELLNDPATSKEIIKIIWDQICHINSYEILFDNYATRLKKLFRRFPEFIIEQALENIEFASQLSNQLILSKKQYSFIWNKYLEIFDTYEDYQKVEAFYFILKLDFPHKKAFIEQASELLINSNFFEIKEHLHLVDIETILNKLSIDNMLYYKDSLIKHIGEQKFQSYIELKKLSK